MLCICGIKKKYIYCGELIDNNVGLEYSYDKSFLTDSWKEIFGINKSSTKPTQESTKKSKFPYGRCWDGVMVKV